MESVESGKWRSEWVSRDIAEWSGMVWSMEWYGVVRSGMVEKLQTHPIQAVTRLSAFLVKGLHAFESVTCVADR